MSKCEACAHWIVARVTQYGNGEIKENWRAEDGSGFCDSLNIETQHDFGCNAFIPAA